MANYHLTKKAEDDLLQIALYGNEHFGIQQSRHYRDKFKQHFLELAAQPKHYQSVDHIRTGYRRSICGVHSIYYQIEQDGIAIIRILGRQDPKRQFK